MINKERLTGVMEGDFVVFLIGMRINKPLGLTQVDAGGGRHA